jgi:hypothetical protein
MQVVTPATTAAHVNKFASFVLCRRYIDRTILQICKGKKTTDDTKTGVRVLLVRGQSKQRR